MSKAQTLVDILRTAKPMTVGDMESLRISNCPWKRLSESGRKHLRPGEKIVKETGSDGLVRYSVRGE